jgi:hypothetical protein
VAASAFFSQLCSAITIYKTTVIDALKEHDPVTKENVCNLFLQSVPDGVDPQFVLFPMRHGFRYMEM